jgi:hypothetical protein
MGNPAEERRIFTAFVNDCPSFAGSPVNTWAPPPEDPPDIHCSLEDGRSIGVGLTNWLDEKQIAEAKGQESMEEPFRRAPYMVPNETLNFEQVWMRVRGRLRKGDEAALKDEMTHLVLDLDKKWGTELDSQMPYWDEFTGYPTLARYLVRVEFFKRRPRRFTGGPSQLGWLTFRCRGGAYSPHWMVETLYGNIKAKIDKYSAKPPGLSAFFLLVHYDFKAYAYNFPVEGIGISYPEAVDKVSRRLGGAKGVFDEIFVYIDIEDEDVKDKQRSFRI